MKIIFLDIDGVLNHGKWYKERFEMKKELDFDMDYPKFEFCPTSVKFLNEITDLTGAKIVLSSTWRKGRTLEQIQEIFDLVGITGELIDKTPLFHYQKHEGYPYLGSVQRGVEIDEWLKNKGFQQISWCKDEFQKYIDKSGIENYVILDDDSDFLIKQIPHFVHIPPHPRHDDGLDEKYRDIIIEKLNKTAIELNYED